MRIAVLGAGGIGCYYGGALARAGHRVALLARGANLDALLARGLEVRTADGNYSVKVEATDDPKRLGAADFAIISVKTYSLTEIAPAARLLAEAGATIVPLVNGVEAADRMQQAGIPRERILGGLTQISAARVGPGIVERRSPFQRVVVGELAGGASERAERIASAFRDAGADASVSNDIVADLWRKLAFIAAMATACGLARSPIGPVRDAPLGSLLIERAVREAFTVARARGVALGDDEESKTLRFIESLGAAMKPSFLLDLESGGRTELDDLSGAVSRLGREAGVATPVHDTATAALGVGISHEH
ncbi:MAG TPA: 2-dehydropantoate 2-reductase [Thermoanaerobaculia bacterium]|nr:2-dehydropantoate 2-reductase [Thermoanaerobaculia bacterium]